jgi:hypothetical protein
MSDVRRRERGRDHLPLVPSYILLRDKGRERLRKGTAGNGDGEPAVLVDGFLLGFEDVLCERIGEI